MRLGRVRVPLAFVFLLPLTCSPYSLAHLHPAAQCARIARPVMSGVQPERSPSVSPPAPHITPARPARLLRAAAARQVLRGVSATPLSAAVRHAEEEALGRRRHAERSREANLSGLWRKDWDASDSMVRAPRRCYARARDTQHHVGNLSTPAPAAQACRFAPGSA